MKSYLIAVLAFTVMFANMFYLGALCLGFPFFLDGYMWLWFIPAPFVCMAQPTLLKWIFGSLDKAFS